MGTIDQPWGGGPVLGCSAFSYVGLSFLGDSGLGENFPLVTISCVDEGALFESSEEDLFFGTPSWGKTFP